MKTKAERIVEFCMMKSPAKVKKLVESYLHKNANKIIQESEKKIANRVLY